MLPRISRFSHSHEGAVLVEFVLVLPILILIILTLLELGIMLTIKTNLQSAVMSGASYGEKGNYVSGSTRTISAQNVMKQALSGLLDPAKVSISIQSYPTFAIANIGGAGTSGTGNPGQVGAYQIQYTYTPVSPLVAGIFGAAKVLKATTYSRNEATFPS
jgi:Flp pilus assembly protein TadG